MTDLTRRNDLSRMSPEELAIFNCIGMVEKLEADTRLTNCVMHLGEAKNWLADFIDKLPIKEETFLDRLEKEEKELGNKIVSLVGALNSDGFAAKVGKYQFELLSLQHSIMASYRRVLNLRITDLKQQA